VLACPWVSRWCSVVVVLLAGLFCRDLTAAGIYSICGVDPLW